MRAPMDQLAMDDVASVATTRYASDDLPERDRVSVWRDYLSYSLIELELKPDALSNFRSILATRPFFDMQLLKMTITATDLIRQSGMVDGADYFLLHINYSGDVHVSSSGDQILLNEGDAVLLDSTRSFTISRRGTGSSYFLRIPRARLSALNMPLDSGVMNKIANVSGGTLNLFTSYLDSLLHQGAFTSSLAHRLAYKHVTELLVVLLDANGFIYPIDNTDEIFTSNRGMPTMRFSAAKAYITARAHQAISIDTVSTYLGVTRRYLQRLFEMNNLTFTDFITDIRLTRAHAMLCDPQRNRIRIRDLSVQCGFKDVSHFNRLFRERFGCTPMALRKNTTLGAAKN
jgi:AraC-like DNA-binding protein